MKKLSSIILVLSIAAGFLSSCSFTKAGTEQNIYFLQLAGPFYTSSRSSDAKENSFLRERRKTIDEVINLTEDAFRYSERASTGFVRYEENLLDYIESADIDKSLADSVDKIISGIAANRSLMAMYATEMETYENAKTSNDANEAIIKHFMYESVSELVDLQNRYSDWLRTAAASVSYMVSIDSERKAEKVISSSASIYKRKIHYNLEKAGNFIGLADGLYDGLVSVDYHSAYLYLDSANEILTEIKERKTNSTAQEEAIAGLETAILDAMDSLNDAKDISPLPEIGGSSFFTRSVNAGEEDALIDFGILSESLKYYRLSTGLTAPRPESTESIEEMHADEIREISGKITDASKVEGLLQEAVSKGLPSESTTTNDNNEKRETAIGLIWTGQTIVRGIRLARPDFAYSTAINRIADLIAGGKNISPEAAANAISLVKNELNELIGENRDKFLDALLNQAAEEVYGTFEVWRDSIGDLSNHTFSRNDIETFLVLLGYGITMEENNIISESAAPSPASDPPAPQQSVSSPEASETPVSAVPYEPIESYDVFNIAATYDTLMNLSNRLTNENILSIIYGWSDPINYSSFTKEDKPDGNGGIRGWKYLDSSGRPVGWESTAYGETLEFKYHFPADMDSSMKVIRYGTLEQSTFFQVETEDEASGRKTSIRFNQDPQFNGDSIVHIYEAESGIKDGLNTTSYNSNPTFEVYVEGSVYESYTFSKGSMIREVATSYDGYSVIEHTRLYYEDGKLKQEKYEKDGQEYGLFEAFNKDGVLVLSIEYADGAYNGDHRSFYDDGSLKTLTTYSEGKKEGPALSYYSNDGHPLEYSGSYKNNERDGKWEAYTVEGTRKSIMNYKEGVFDGEYKTFATGNTSSSSIHVFGQYSNGNRTGEWLYGYNNEGWAEKVYYENDIKVWMEKADSNIRTYYKPDGSVDHTESKP